MAAIESAYGQVETRLAELGVVLPAPAAPVAAYVPAVREGRLLWTAGQLPFVDGALVAVGKVGHGDGQVSPERAAELARICAINALAAARGLLGNLDSVVRVAKLVGFVASDSAFTGQAAVMNGASEFLGTVFGDAGVHARSTVGVNVLPLDAPVEIELTLVVD